MISLALERSAMAEAAVVALWAQRARTVARRVFTAWLAAAVRSRADKAEEEIKRLKFQMAEAEAAAEVAAEAAAAAAAAKKNQGRLLTRLTSTKSVKKAPSDGSGLAREPVRGVSRRALVSSVAGVSFFKGVDGR